MDIDILDAYTYKLANKDPSGMTSYSCNKCEKICGRIEQQTEAIQKKTGKGFHTSFFSVLAKQSRVLLYVESPIILDFT
jgi:hypothetical protein